LNQWLDRFTIWIAERYGYKTSVRVEDGMQLFSGAVLGAILAWILFLWIIARTHRVTKMKEVVAYKVTGPDGKTRFFVNDKKLSEGLDTMIALFLLKIGLHQGVVLRNIRRTKVVLCVVVILALIAAFFGISFVFHVTPIELKTRFGATK
jgi:hypothetical protein